MKNQIMNLGFGIMMLALFSPNFVLARDTKYKLSVEEVMNSPEAKKKLDKHIRFVFGTKSGVKLSEDFGEFMSNKKANAFGKSDLEACQRAFLSAMLSFQDRARKTGADTVTDIQSYYRKELFDSANQFECGAGALMAGVTFKGRVGKRKKGGSKTETEPKTESEPKKEKASESSEE